MKLTFSICIKRLLYQVFMLACGVSLYANSPVIPSANNSIKFIQNKGQWNSNILFKADIPGGALFVQNTQLTYVFIDKQAIHDYHHGQDVLQAKAHAIQVSFDGATQPNNIITNNALSEYYNYFIGNDKTRWASHCQAYTSITLKNIYAGIDFQIIADGTKLKTNFIVSANANTKQIKLKYKGQENLQLVNGNLSYNTCLGAIQEQTPISFQQNEIIKTKYLLNNNTVQFLLNDYNKNEELIIDPQIIFATYVGSVADNFGNTATYDNDGNGYAGGSVYDVGFPTTTGAYNVNFNGGINTGSESARDAVIVKFNSTGTQMLYATYLGGSHNEQPHSMIVNAKNELIILGSTLSNNFPTTSNVFDNSHNGGYDIFISKLSSDGTKLTGSTFVGGSQDDGVSGNSEYSYFKNSSKLNHNYSDWYRGEIFIDGTGNLVVASTTRSFASFPLLHAFQKTFGGVQDAVIFKMNDALNQLLFSSYFGGISDDAGYALCFDKLNNIYLTGGTLSYDLPLKINNIKGGIDGFVAKINGSGALIKSTYVGTSEYDQSYLIQNDKDDNIYILGQTQGNITPTVGTYSNAGSKQFIQVYNNNLTTILRQTIFGASGANPQISPTAFVVDECSRLYIAGWGGSTNTRRGSPTSFTYGMPVSADAFQKSTDGSDFYIMVINTMLDKFVYGSYIGGNVSGDHVDGGTSHLDKNFVIYQTVCAGCDAATSDFPTTPNAYSKINPAKRPNSVGTGGCNIVQFKFDLNTYKSIPVFKDTTIVLYAQDTLKFKIRVTSNKDDNIDFTYRGSLLDSTKNNVIISKIIKQPGLSSADIYWPTTCSDRRSDTLELMINIINDVCPAPIISNGKIKIVVLSPTLPEANPSCLQYIDANTLKLNWNASPALRTFKEFVILRSINGGSYVPYQKEPNQFNTKMIDPFAFNHLLDNYCYRIFSNNNCQINSDTSHSICSIAYNDIIKNIFLGGNDTLLYTGPNDVINISDSISHFDKNDSVFLTLSSIVKDSENLVYDIKNAKGKALYSFTYPVECKYKLYDTLLFSLNMVNNRCPTPNIGDKKIRVVVVPYIPNSNIHLACPKVYNKNKLDLIIKNKKPNKHIVSYIIKQINNDNTTIDVGLFSGTQYDTIITVNSKLDFENTKVCFYMYAKDACGNLSDTINKVCTHDENILPPNALYFYNVTVVDDKAVKLTWVQPKDTNYWQYRIFKQVRNDGKDLYPIATIDKKTDTTFLDEAVNVDEAAYCYQVQHVDQCGVSSIDNTKSCSILLKGNSTPLKHKIFWSNYIYWPTGIKSYDIIRNEPAYMQDSILVNSQFKQEQYLDEKWNYDNGLYYYKIIAHEADNGYNATSQSNTIELVQAPILNVPNAYSPNGDNINDFWKSIPVFVKEFNLKLYNRWGEKIWETNNKKEFFSNKFCDNFSQNEISLNVFVYVITYSGWDGSVNTKTGNVTMLR